MPSDRDCYGTIMAPCSLSAVVPFKPGVTCFDCCETRLLAFWLLLYPVGALAYNLDAAFIAHCQITLDECE